MLSIIGNSPSSGSNLLAQLLDSTKYSACGVELNLLSNTKIYDFESFKKNIRHSSKASGIHRIRNRINFHRLHSYGLNEKELKAMVTGSRDLAEFCDHFAFRFLALRGKRDNGIVFEKTPENINCIREFTETFKDSRFIHIVRNPLYIYPSLMKRKFPRYISLLSWLIDVAKYLKYKDHPQVMLIKYEDLVRNPYAITRDILKTTAGITDLSDEEIEEGYRKNKCRELFSPKPKTWNVNTYGPVKNANVTQFSNQQLTELAALLKVRVRKSYAEEFDLAPVSFTDAIKELGYHDAVMEQLGEFKDKARMPGKTAEDYARLLLKWEEDLRHGDAGIFALRHYLKPVEEVS